MKRENFLAGGVGALLVPFTLGRAAHAAPPNVNAWPEGSKHPVYDSPPYKLVSADEAGFEMFDREHARRFPLLARALEEIQPAHNIKIEWMDNLSGGAPILRYNWQQISRFPFSGRSVERFKERAFNDMCRSMEQCLWHGVRSGPEYDKPWSGGHVRTSAGVYELLGRKPKPGDTIKLRPLRIPVWRVYDNGASQVGEWLVEYSLQAGPR